MIRYENSSIIKNAKKIDSDGKESYVRRLSTTVYPTFTDDISSTKIIAQDGDRLDILAKEFYNDERMWFVIAKANNLGKGSMAIPPGTLISIPYETPMGISSLIEDFNRSR